MHRKATMILCALISLALSGAVAQAQEPKKVTVSTTGGGGAIGIISNIIAARGLGKKHGLNIEFKQFDPAKAEEAVFFKTVDAGIFAPISSARANLKGQKIQLFHPVMLSIFTFLVPPDSPAKTIDDLKGKKLGLFARVTAMYTSYATIVKMKGGDIEKDYKLAFGTPQAVSAFLIRKDVDAIGMFEPRASLMVSAGQARELVTFNALWQKETGHPLLIIGIAGHKEWLDGNPEAVRGLGRAYADGVRALKENPAKVMEEQKAYIGIKTPEELRRVAAIMPGLFVEGWTPKLLESTKLLIQKNVEMKILEQLPKQEYLRKLE